MAKSKIYKELTDSDIQKIIHDLYGNHSQCLNCEIMKGGAFNTTYRIETDTDKDKIILRAAPTNKDLLFEFEKDMMSAEPLFHQLLHENDIPTSEIIKYSAFGDVIDREYIISKYMDTTPMNDSSLSDTNLDHVYEEIGSLTHKMHGIVNNRFGWKRINGAKEFDKWSDFILAYANECADRAQDYKLFALSDVELFRQIFIDNTTINLLDGIVSPCMIHTDLWEGNVLLKKDNNIYKVAAIIDLERIIFGDAYWDLISPWIINDSFLKGYNQKTSKTKTEDDNKRGNLYKILFNFYGAYVCLIEHDENEWYEGIKNFVIPFLHDMSL